jgi:hypothetical protein
LTYLYSEIKNNETFFVLLDWLEVKSDKKMKKEGIQKTLGLVYVPFYLLL